LSCKAQKARVAMNGTSHSLAAIVLLPHVEHSSPLPTRGVKRYLSALWRWNQIYGYFYSTV